MSMVLVFSTQKKADKTKTDLNCLKKSYAVSLLSLLVEFSIFQTMIRPMIFARRHG